MVDFPASTGVASTPACVQGRPVLYLHLLGPVEATLDGHPIPLGAAKQRAVLAMLGLRANETVSVDRLVEGLWGDHPPASAPKMVQLYVSQLRRLLAGGEARIVTHGRGYELCLPGDAVDAACFERLVERASRARGTPDGDAREALALWRGAALADLADEPFAPAEIRRLDELRLRAAELAVDSDLAAGQSERALAEVERLIDEHGLREHLHALRMLALYRSGRQAEALEAYVAARRRLVDDVGIEPGAELRELHERILAQDPTLLLATLLIAPTTMRSDVEVEEPGAGRVRRGGWRTATMIASAGVLLTAVGVAGFGLAGTDGPQLLPQVNENAVGVIDPGADGVVAQYPAGPDPSAIAVAGRSAWVANEAHGTVRRVDRDGGQIVTQVGGSPAGIAIAGGSVWVTDRQARSVSQIDPASNRVVQRVEAGNAPSGIAGGFGAVWVASEVDRTITPISLSRGAVGTPIDLGAAPTALASGAGAVWAASEEGGVVFRIEPRTGAVVASIGVGSGPVGIAVGEGGVWVANRQDGTVSLIDPRTDAVTATVSVGRSVSAIAAGGGSVWVADSVAGVVSRIDPATRRVTGTVPVVNSPSALVFSGGRVWATARASLASHRGGTLRVAAITRYVGCCIEPGVYNSDVNPLLAPVYDGLVAYRRVGGSGYGRLVGNLAVDIPEPSPDGRTYVFRLRRGIRFSHGAPVRPVDFRASLEDLLRRHGRLLPPFFSRILGAPACVKTPADCDLSKGIETDARAMTITVRLSGPDPELLHKLAQPFGLVVPADHPFRPGETPPGTGPYRYASFDRRAGARLVRNRHFRVWSPDARPDGVVDEIRVRLRNDVDAQVAAVKRDEADVMVVSGPFGGPLSPSGVQALTARYAGRMHTDAVPELDFMFLNTRTPPFDDVDVRRALNYAVDRREIGRLAGGADLAQPTCQLVPPGFPGHAPSCRYTTSPSRSGAWNGPDVDRARRLIARSGTRGMRVTVWGFEGKRAITDYFAGLLRRLGYRSDLRVLPDYVAYRTLAADSRTRAQIGIEGWSSDFPTASAFSQPFVCGGITLGSPYNLNEAQFCDRRLEGRIREAGAARGAAADAIWRDVYDRLADAAPAVPLVNRRTVTLVSTRVGNHQYHPMWGTLFDQLWVR